MTGRKTSNSPLSGNFSDSKDHDQYLPIANVSRIMKKSLPANAKISKEAKETVQECVSEFINFITGEASEKCQREKRKTVNGDDLLWAMTTLGFENYIGPLKSYLNKYREIEEDQKNSGTPVGDHRIGENVGTITAHDQFSSGNYNSRALGLEAVTNPKSQPGIVSYGEDLKSSGEGDFDFGKNYDQFDGNGKRSDMASNLYHGVEW